MSIAQEMKNLTEEIAISYGERMSWLDNHQKGTHQMMGRIRNDHQGMVKDLGAFLDEGESTRIGEFKKMLGQIQSRRREREGEVVKIRNEAVQTMTRLAKEIEEMASQLEEFLSGSESQRLSEFDAFVSGVKRRTAEIKKETVVMLTAAREDFKQAHNHWQNLAKILVSKRAGGKIPRETKVPKRVEKAVEEAFEEGDLKARVLNVIEANSEGISLRQIADKLHTAHIRLAKLIKGLIEEGKIFKRDSLYFPA